MKKFKFVTAFLIASLCFITTAMAETAMYTGVLTENTLVCQNRCVVTAVFVHADGSHEATVTLYDTDTETEENEIHSWTVMPGSKSGGYVLNTSRRTKNGLYVTVSGTGAAFSIDYQGGN